MSLENDIEMLNRLMKTSDEKRDTLTTTLITIYGAASSGLFLLIATKDPRELLQGKYQSISFIAVLLSSVAIVFLSILEKLLMFFASRQVTQNHIANIKSNNHKRITSLKPKRVNITLIKIIPWVLLGLIALNAFAICCYAVARINQ